MGALALNDQRGSDPRHWSIHSGTAPTLDTDTIWQRRVGQDECRCSCGTSRLPMTMIDVRCRFAAAVASSATIVSSNVSRCSSTDGPRRRPLTAKVGEASCIPTRSAFGDITVLAPKTRSGNERHHLLSSPTTRAAVTPVSYAFTGKRRRPGGRVTSIRLVYY